MRIVIANTKMSVPKYFAGVFVVQPEKRSVTSVEKENVVDMPIGMLMWWCVAVAMGEVVTLMTVVVAIGMSIVEAGVVVKMLLAIDVILISNKALNTMAILFVYEM